MTVDQLLTGNIEQEIRDGLAKLREVAPAGTRACITLHVYDSASGFLSASVSGGNTDIVAAYGCASIPEAVSKCVRDLQSPERVRLFRESIELRIAELQQTLDATPQPIVAMEAPETEANQA